MKAIKTVFRARKNMSYQTTQLLYGVSILLTFVAAGRLGALV